MTLPCYTAKGNKKKQFAKHADFMFGDGKNSFLFTGTLALPKKNNYIHLPI
jgi:hypothetical protein